MRVSPLIILRERTDPSIPPQGRGLSPPNPFPIAFRLGNNAVMTVDKTIDLFLDLKGHKLSFYFLVVPELPYEIIVGADFFQKWKIKLDPIAEDFIIDEKALEIMLV